MAGQLPFPFMLIEVEREFADTFQESHRRVGVCPTCPSYRQWLCRSETRVQTCALNLGGAANLDMLYSLAKSVGARKIVETGVAYGWSSLAFILAVKDMDDGYVYSTDLPRITYTYSTDPTVIIRPEHDAVGVAIPETLRSHWRLFKMSDRKGLPKILREAGAVDLAHYDSDKSPEGRAFGYDAIWQSLRGGGVLISDDVGDNLEFKNFAEMVNRIPVIVEWNGKYQGILIK